MFAKSQRAVENREKWRKLVARDLGIGESEGSIQFFPEVFVCGDYYVTKLDRDKRRVDQWLHGTVTGPDVTTYGTDERRIDDSFVKTAMPETKGG